MTIVEAAEQLQLPAPTLHRWISEGFLDAGQLTPGAPGRIRLTDQIRALFVDQAPDGWLAMLEATHAHQLTRATVMKNIKTGALQALYVRTGRRKGLRSNRRNHHKHCSRHDNQEGTASRAIVVAEAGRPVRVDGVDVGWRTQASTW